MITRREFFYFAGMLAITSKVLAQTPLMSGGLILSGSVNRKLHFIKINFKNKSITKIPANCGPHAFVVDGQMVYGVEKKGRSLVAINFDTPLVTPQKILSPEGIIFYGHCIVFGEKIIATGVRIPKNNVKYDFNQNESNFFPGVLVIYDKHSLKLLNIIEKIGEGPHEIVKHRDLLYVASYSNKSNLSSLLMFNPVTFEKKQEYFLDKDHKHLQFRHFALNEERIVMVLSAMKGKIFSDLAVGEFSHDGKFNIKSVSNVTEPSLDFDHTTSFIHNNKVFVVMHMINRILVFDKSITSLKYKNTDYSQVMTLSKEFMSDISFIDKDSFINSPAFKIKSHLCII